MELLQKRGFSAFFSDTFRFIKENAAHFFTNYFIINGIFLLLSLVKNYFDGAGDSFPVIIELLFGLVSIAFAIINWTFVTIYMILYNEKKTDFDYQDIMNAYKEKIGKILIFMLASILVAIPVIIVFYIVMLLLAITIVGFVLIPLLYASLVLLFALALFEYLNTDRNIFDCYTYAFKLFSKKFWATTGSTALLYLMIFVIYGFALGATGMVASFMELNTSDPEDMMVSIQTILASPSVLITLTLLSILMVVVQISQGIIYFSQKELLENISVKSTIDDIGRNDDE